jgi:hypothetical protein
LAVGDKDSLLGNDTVGKIHVSYSRLQSFSFRKRSWSVGASRSYGTFQVFWEPDSRLP